MNNNDIIRTVQSKKRTIIHVLIRLRIDEYEPLDLTALTITTTKVEIFSKVTLEVLIMYKETTG